MDDWLISRRFVFARKDIRFLEGSTISKCKVIPTDPSTATPTIEAALCELKECGVIVRYDLGGQVNPLASSLL
jgi:hypothetical protein